MSLRWLDSMSVGSYALDQDHKAIIERLRAVEEACLKPDFATARVLADELIDFLHRHQTRELDYIQGLGYAATQEISSGHEWAMAKIVGIARHIGENDLVAAKLAADASDAFLQYLIGIDLKFKSHIETIEGQRRRG